MKNISAGLLSHLAQEVTTLCTCWRIERTDGTVLGFTDHDVDLNINGLVYEAETGFNRTAVSSDSTFAVDNMDVTGFLDSERISENDLRNGLFDFAKVFVFLVNWADTEQGPIKMRRGWLGEVQLNDNGMFEVEVRGLNQVLTYNFMESFQPECRTDFGSPLCTLNIADYTTEGMVFGLGSQRQTFTISQITGVIGGSSVGAHRYWRIKPTTVPDANVGGFAEINFFDQQGNEILGGTPSAGSQFSSSFTPAHARDKNNNTAWATQSGQRLDTWQIDFGEAADVKAIRMISYPSNLYQRTPTAFDLQYSDDGAVWTTAKSCNAAWSASGQEGNWVLGIENAGIRSPIPVPTEGVETYVGGTLKFMTGGNAGKQMEIIEYEESTGLITVFEPFPYNVMIGDQFELAQGCDKMFETCQKYGNQNNFRGEPHVPGNDELLRYPDAPPE